MNIKLLTVDQLAELLQMSPTYVRDALSKSRDFPSAYRIGGSLRWKADEIEEWVESRAVKSTTRAMRASKRRIAA